MAHGVPDLHPVQDLFGSSICGTRAHYGAVSTACAATKYLDAPLRITDVAQWLERSPNSVSMIVDRMVKAGLLRRVRDRKDRRVVNVFLTSKGEKAFGPATVAVRKAAQQIMLSLSQKDKHAFVSLSEMINHRLLQYLNPKADIEVMLKDDIKRRDALAKRWLK